MAEPASPFDLALQVPPAIRVPDVEGIPAYGWRTTDDPSWYPCHEPERPLDDLVEFHEEGCHPCDVAIEASLRRLAAATGAAVESWAAVVTAVKVVNLSIWRHRRE